jgi:hypothetical protein
MKENRRHHSDATRRLQTSAPPGSSADRKNCSRAFERSEKSWKVLLTQPKRRYSKFRGAGVCEWAIMLRRLLLSLVFAFAVSPAFADNILVIVDLQMQTMQVRIDGVTKYRWDVSTGRAGYDTPPGRYQPTRMHKKYFSRKYDNAPMPYAIFFHEGYAIHGTTDLKRLGRIASHGCVRLHPENAATLFALVKEIGPENTVIRIRSYAQGVAVLQDPEPVAPAVEAAEITAAAIDDMTTGGTVHVKVSWLRRGLNS